MNKQTTQELANELAGVLQQHIPDVDIATIKNASGAVATFVAAKYPNTPAAVIDSMSMSEYLTLPRTIGVQSQNDLYLLDMMTAKEEKDE